MWLWLRKTASRGRSVVPASFLRMRDRIRARTSSFVLTFIAPQRAFRGGVPATRPRPPSLEPRIASATASSVLFLLGSRGPCGPGLARLLLQHLAHVPDPLLLVGVGAAQAANLGGHLAH